MNEHELHKKKNIALVQVILSSLLFSTGGLLIKSVPWPSLAISGGRGIIATIMMLILIKAKGWKFRFEKKSFLQAFFMAITLTLFVASNKLTTAANAIVIQYMSPVWILVISALFLRQKVKKSDIIVVVVAFFGMALFFFEQLSGEGMLGNCLALLSGISLSIMYVVVGEAEEEVRFSGMMMGHALTFLVALPTIVTTELEFSPVAIGCILALGIFQIWLPYVLIGLAMSYCNALTCNLVGILEPLLNPFWVFLATGEAPGLLALVGGVIIIVSITVWCWWNDKVEKEAA